MQKCSKCKKKLDLFKFEIKQDGDTYSTCIDCRLVNNKQSRESYKRKEKCICEVCKKSYSCKKNLKRHLWQVHDIGEKKWFSCTDCEYKCKNNSDMKDHLWQVHDIGEGKWFDCTECKYKCKDNSNLKKHLWQVHDIGEGKWFNCPECDYKSKSNSNIKKHLWQVHNIGEGKWFNCTDCVSKFKSNSSLKVHLSNVHDIGDLTCNYCHKNVFRLNDYTDKNTGKVKICRECYNKATGYSTKKEKQMVEYIKKTELKNYIILQNRIIKGNSCNTNCRPDLMLSSSKELTIVVECDEFQHSGYSFETERMNAIIDEIKDHRVVFIRWNPDTYKVKKHRGKVNREQRLEMLVELIRKLCNKRWEEEENILVYYMFYTEDNPIITKSLERKLIYEKE